MQRFPEGIDVSASRQFVRPEDADPMEHAPIRTRREKWRANV